MRLNFVKDTIIKNIKYKRKVILLTLFITSNNIRKI